MKEYDRLEEREAKKIFTEKTGKLTRYGQGIYRNIYLGKGYNEKQIEFKDFDLVETEEGLKKLLELK